jgi:hypothetical protein
MIPTAEFTKWFFLLLAETFGVADTPHGYILDTGQSGLLGTIDSLSAEAASAARGPEHATIASHCGHVLFLLQYFAAYERGETPAADWAGSWATRVVDDAAWQALRQELRTTYDAVMARLQARDDWPEAAIAASLMLLAHCAYHVGEIRQRLLWVTS